MTSLSGLQVFLGWWPPGSNLCLQSHGLPWLIRTLVIGGEVHSHSPR